MMGIGVDVQLVFLVLSQARLPVAFDAVPVHLLALLVGGKLILAGSQAVVLAIVAAARRQDVLLDVGRWARPHVSRYNRLAAQQFAAQLANCCLVHAERCLAPQSATVSQEAKSRRHYTRAT